MILSNPKFLFKFQNKDFYFKVETIIQILQGVFIFHRNNYAGLDLKLTNMMADRYGIISIIDLGLVKKNNDKYEPIETFPK